MRGRASKIGCRDEPILANLLLQAQVPLIDVHVRNVIDVGSADGNIWRPGRVPRDIRTVGQWKRISARLVGPGVLKTHIRPRYALCEWGLKAEALPVKGRWIIVKSSAGNTHRGTAIAR